MSYKKLLQISKPIDHDAPQSAFNGVLQDLVNLIITNNPTVQVLHKYEFGTEEWNDYPCFGDGTRALNYAQFTETSNFWVQNAPNSDVYILGRNDNNYCMCMAFTKLVKNNQYMLLISCCPGLTANTTIYEKYYNNTIGTQFANSPSLIAHEIRPTGYYNTNASIDDLRKRNYKVILYKDTVNNLLEMNVTYVSSEFGSAYKLGNSTGYADYFNLILFKNSVDHTVFGITPASYSNADRTGYNDSWAIHHCIFDFDKPVTIRERDNELLLKHYPSNNPSSIPYSDNNYLYPYCWLGGHGNYGYSSCFGARMSELPIIDESHCLNGKLMTNDSWLQKSTYVEGSSVFGFNNARSQDWSKLCAVPNTWNIPKIPFGSIFLRQYYQPNGTGEKLNLWFAFTPLESPSIDYTQRLVGDIITVPDGRKFMRLLPGLTTPVLRVE